MLKPKILLRSNYLYLHDFHIKNHSFKYLFFKQVSVFIFKQLNENKIVYFLSFSFYSSQKKTLEVNPYHPLIKELNAKVKADPEDNTAKDLVRVMFETAAIRSGYTVKDSLDFAKRIERMLRLSMGVDMDAKVELPDDGAEEETSEEVSVTSYAFNLNRK